MHREGLEKVPDILNFGTLLAPEGEGVWSEFLATDTEVPGSIPGTARFFWVVVGLERGLLRLVSLLRSLNKKVAAPGLENRV